MDGVASTPALGKLRIGTLGAASITPAALIAPARTVPEVEVAAVAARNRATAEAFAAKHGIGRVHASYDELLADPDLDAVYVPLPNGLHGKWAMAALEAGKHVLCEKPLAANAAEAAEMARTAEACGRVLMEAFHWRYHPMNQRLLDLVTQGALGQLQRVDAAFCFPLLGRSGDIRWRQDLAGGALMDAGCYPVNMVRAVGAAAGLGEPEVVSATALLARDRRSRGVVDRALRGELVWTPTDAGAVHASVRCSMWSRDVVAVRLDVQGDRGRLTARNPVLPHRFGRLSGHTEAGPVRERASRVTSYARQLQAFAAAVATRAPFPTTAEDGVRNMAVIDALYRAAGLSPHQPAA